MSKYLDMLVKLGVGNAHPGGFASTLEQLRTFPVEAGSRVLEVGCGTGRTACHLSALGCLVTGVDVREEMIQKAVKRAEKEQSKIDFHVADARQLPFADRSFDVVIAESVSVFAGPAACLKEYARVLNDGGYLYDREIMRVGRMPSHVMDRIEQFYGFSSLPDADGWLRLIERHFRMAELWKPSPFNEEMWEGEYLFPDWSQPVDEGAYCDAEVREVASQYEQLMGEHAEFFGYGLLIGIK